MIDLGNISTENSNVQMKLSEFTDARITIELFTNFFAQYHTEESGHIDLRPALFLNTRLRLADRR